ncbi:MAG: hypothetical protein RLZZ370_723 [Bacteroidota bacterium]
MSFEYRNKKPRPLVGVFEKMESRMTYKPL